jgi:cyclase
MTTSKAPASEMRELARGVYAYLQPHTGWFMSNAGLIVGKKEAIIIDSLTNKSQVEEFIRKIKQVTDKPIRFVINTHVHGDHIFTNHFFKDAMVICSSRCREETIKMPPDRIERTLKPLFPGISFAGARITLQDMAFEKTLTIYQDEREIQLVDLGPGHSQSDTYVHLPKEKIVFCGDLLFSGSPQMLLNGCLSCLIQNLDVLAGLDAKVYVPGHGPVGGKETVHGMREYLVVVRDEARKCFDKGMSYEEAARTIDIGRFKEWGKTELLYGNCARAYSEFRGEPPARELNVAEIMARMLPQK